MVLMGADSICIKDMAGILTPNGAYELVKGLKEAVLVPIEIHTHCTSGIASMTYLKAVEAGVDIIDTAISPFSEGTSQPPTESMAMVLDEGDRGPRLNMGILSEIADYFKPIRDKYRLEGILNAKVIDVEPNTLTYQVPGGMLSNLLSQLEAQGASHHYEAVLKEIPRVRADLGYPPLVTPLSQMVGTQAVFNILTGERYKMVPKEIKEYVKGLYGAFPAPLNESIKQLILGDEAIITVRPADLLEPELEKYTLEIGDLATSLEDVLSYSLFPQVARKFFEARLKMSDVHYITVTM
jgi:oxaloacetate decarboxylase alpha subunit